MPIAAVTVVAGWAWLRRRAEALNALALGDETSAALGVRSSPRNPSAVARLGAYLRTVGR